MQNHIPNENLSAITSEKKIIKFDKPIYVGMYQACFYTYCCDLCINNDALNMIACVYYNEHFTTARARACASH